MKLLDLFVCLGDHGSDSERKVFLHKHWSFFNKNNLVVFILNHKCLNKGCSPSGWAVNLSSGWPGFKSDWELSFCCFSSFYTVLAFSKNKNCPKPELRWFEFEVLVIEAVIIGYGFESCRVSSFSKLPSFQYLDVFLVFSFPNHALNSATHRWRG